MGQLTTHVLDTAHGCPAAGMQVTLWAIAPDGSAERLQTVTLNSDGRVGRPLLEGAALAAGRYRLVFGVGDYFAAKGVVLPTPVFLDQVPLDFGVADPAAHYHVPLLASPWSYSTYRGS